MFLKLVAQAFDDLAFQLALSNPYHVLFYCFNVSFALGMSDATIASIIEDLDGALPIEDFLTLSTLSPAEQDIWADPTNPNGIRHSYLAAFRASAIPSMFLAKLPTLSYSEPVLGENCCALCAQQFVPLTMGDELSHAYLVRLLLHSIQAPFSQVLTTIASKQQRLPVSQDIRMLFNPDGYKLEQRVIDEACKFLIDQVVPNRSPFDVSSSAAPPATSKPSLFHPSTAVSTSISLFNSFTFGHRNTSGNNQNNNNNNNTNNNNNNNNNDISTNTNSNNISNTTNNDAYLQHNPATPPAAIAIQAITSPYCGHSICTTCFVQYLQVYQTSRFSPIMLCPVHLMTWVKSAIPMLVSPFAREMYDLESHRLPICHKPAIAAIPLLPHALQQPFENLKIAMEKFHTATISKIATLLLPYVYAANIASHYKRVLDDVQQNNHSNDNFLDHSSSDQHMTDVASTVASTYNAINTSTVMFRPSLPGNEQDMPSNSISNSIARANSNSDTTPVPNFALLAHITTVNHLIVYLAQSISLSKLILATEFSNETQARHLQLSALPHNLFISPPLIPQPSANDQCVQVHWDPFHEKNKDRRSLQQSSLQQSPSSSSTSRLPTINVSSQLQPPSTAASSSSTTTTSGGAMTDSDSSMQRNSELEIESILKYHPQDPNPPDLQSYFLHHNSSHQEFLSSASSTSDVSTDLAPPTLITQPLVEGSLSHTLEQSLQKPILPAIFVPPLSAAVKCPDFRLCWCFRCGRVGTYEFGKHDIHPLHVLLDMMKLRAQEAIDQLNNSHPSIGSLPPAVLASLQPSTTTSPRFPTKPTSTPSTSAPSPLITSSIALGTSSANNITVSLPDSQLPITHPKYDSNGVVSYDDMGHAITTTISTTTIITTSSTSTQHTIPSNFSSRGGSSSSRSGGGGGGSDKSLPLSLASLNLRPIILPELCSSSHNHAQSITKPIDSSISLAASSSLAFLPCFDVHNGSVRHPQALLPTPLVQYYFRSNHNPPEEHASIFAVSPTRLRSILPMFYSVPAAPYTSQDRQRDISLLKQLAISFASSMPTTSSVQLISSMPTLLPLTHHSSSDSSTTTETKTQSNLDSPRSTFSPLSSSSSLLIPAINQLSVVPSNQLCPSASTTLPPTPLLHRRPVPLADRSNTRPLDSPLSPGLKRHMNIPAPTPPLFPNASSAATIPQSSPATLPPNKQQSELLSLSSTTSPSQPARKCRWCDHALIPRQNDFFTLLVQTQLFHDRMQSLVAQAQAVLASLSQPENGQCPLRSPATPILFMALGSSGSFSHLLDTTCDGGLINIQADRMKKLCNHLLTIHTLCNIRAVNTMCQSLRLETYVNIARSRSNRTPSLSGSNHSPTVATSHLTPTGPAGTPTTVSSHLSSFTTMTGPRNANGGGSIFSSPDLKLLPPSSPFHHVKAVMPQTLRDIIWNYLLLADRSFPYQQQPVLPPKAQSGRPTSDFTRLYKSRQHLFSPLFNYVRLFNEFLVDGGMPYSIAFEDLPSCVQKSLSACPRTLACGCPCFGTRGEHVHGCLPCPVHSSGPWGGFPSDPAALAASSASFVNPLGHPSSTTRLKNLTHNQDAATVVVVAEPSAKIEPNHRTLHLDVSSPSPPVLDSDSGVTPVTPQLPQLGNIHLATTAATAATATTTTTTTTHPFSTSSSTPSPIIPRGGSNTSCLEQTCSSNMTQLHYQPLIQPVCLTCGNTHKDIQPCFQSGTFQQFDQFAGLLKQAPIVVQSLIQASMSNNNDNIQYPNEHFHTNNRDTIFELQHAKKSIKLSSSSDRHLSLLNNQTKKSLTSHHAVNSMDHSTIIHQIYHRFCSQGTTNESLWQFPSASPYHPRFACASLCFSMLLTFLMSVSQQHLSFAIPSLFPSSQAKQQLSVLGAGPIGPIQLHTAQSGKTFADYSSIQRFFNHKTSNDLSSHIQEKRPLISPPQQQVPPIAQLYSHLVSRFITVCTKVLQYNASSAAIPFGQFSTILRSTDKLNCPTTGRPIAAQSLELPQLETLMKYCSEADISRIGSQKISSAKDLIGSLMYDGDYLLPLIPSLPLGRRRVCRHIHGLLCFFEHALHASHSNETAHTSNRPISFDFLHCSLCNGYIFHPLFTFKILSHYIQEQFVAMISLDYFLADVLREPLLTIASLLEFDPQATNGSTIDQSNDKFQSLMQAGPPSAPDASPNRLHGSPNGSPSYPSAHSPNTGLTSPMSTYNSPYASSASVASVGTSGRHPPIVSPGITSLANPASSVPSQLNSSTDHSTVPIVPSSHMFGTLPAQALPAPISSFTQPFYQRAHRLISALESQFPQLANPLSSHWQRPESLAMQLYDTHACAICHVPFVLGRRNHAKEAPPGWSESPKTVLSQATTFSSFSATTCFRCSPWVQYIPCAHHGMTYMTFKCLLCHQQASVTKPHFLPLCPRHSQVDCDTLKLHIDTSMPDQNDKIAQPIAFRTASKFLDDLKEKKSRQRSVANIITGSQTVSPASRTVAHPDRAKPIGSSPIIESVLDPDIVREDAALRTIICIRLLDQCPSLARQLSELLQFAHIPQKFMQRQRSEILPPSILLRMICRLVCSDPDCPNHGCPVNGVTVPLCCLQCSPPQDAAAPTNLDEVPDDNANSSIELFKSVVPNASPAEADPVIQIIQDELSTDISAIEAIWPLTELPSECNPFVSTTVATDTPVTPQKTSLFGIDHLELSSMLSSHWKLFSHLPLVLEADVDPSMRSGLPSHLSLFVALASRGISLMDKPRYVLQRFQHTMDLNGVMFFLGTFAHTMHWLNPHQLGLVSCSSTRLLHESLPVWGMLERQDGRCALAPTTSEQWFCIDLQHFRLVPTGYSIKHYKSLDNECLRNWAFEASHDGVTWHRLSNHVRDASLCGANSSAYFSIDKPEYHHHFDVCARHDLHLRSQSRQNNFDERYPNYSLHAPDHFLSAPEYPPPLPPSDIISDTSGTPQAQSWRFFRILLSGLNDCSHRFMTLLGFELYGTLIIPSFETIRRSFVLMHTLACQKVTPISSFSSNEQPAGSTAFAASSNTIAAGKSPPGRASTLGSPSRPWSSAWNALKSISLLDSASPTIKPMAHTANNTTINAVRRNQSAAVVKYSFAPISCSLLVPFAPFYYIAPLLSRFLPGVDEPFSSISDVTSPTHNFYQHTTPHTITTTNTGGKLFPEESNDDCTLIDLEVQSPSSALISSSSSSSTRRYLALSPSTLAAPISSLSASPPQDNDTLPDAFLTSQFPTNEACVSTPYHPTPLIDYASPVSAAPSAVSGPPLLAPPSLAFHRSVFSDTTISNPMSLSTDSFHFPMGMPTAEMLPSFLACHAVFDNMIHMSLLAAIKTTGLHSILGMQVRTIKAFCYPMTAQQINNSKFANLSHLSTTSPVSSLSAESAQSNLFNADDSLIAIYNPELQRTISGFMAELSRYIHWSSNPFYSRQRSVLQKFVFLCILPGLERAVLFTSVAAASSTPLLNRQLRSLRKQNQPPLSMGDIKSAMTTDGSVSLTDSSADSFNPYLSPIPAPSLESIRKSRSLIQTVAHFQEMTFFLRTISAQLYPSLFEQVEIPINFYSANSFAEAQHIIKNVAIVLDHTSSAEPSRSPLKLLTTLHKKTSISSNLPGTAPATPSIGPAPPNEADSPFGLLALPTIFPHNSIFAALSRLVATRHEASNPVQMGVMHVSFSGLDSDLLLPRRSKTSEQSQQQRIASKSLLLTHRQHMTASNASGLHGLRSLLITPAAFTMVNTYIMQHASTPAAPVGTASAHLDNEQQHNDPSTHMTAEHDQHTKSRPSTSPLAQVVSQPRNEFICSCYLSKYHNGLYRSQPCRASRTAPSVGLKPFRHTTAEYASVMFDFGCYRISVSDYVIGLNLSTEELKQSQSVPDDDPKQHILTNWVLEGSNGEFPNPGHTFPTVDSNVAYEDPQLWTWYPIITHINDPTLKHLSQITYDVTHRRQVSHPLGTKTSYTRPELASGNIESSHLHHQGLDPQRSTTTELPSQSHSNFIPFVPINCRVSDNQSGPYRIYPGSYTPSFLPMAHHLPSSGDKSPRRYVLDSQYQPSSFKYIRLRSLRPQQSFHLSHIDFFGKIFITTSPLKGTPIDLKALGQISTYPAPLLVPADYRFETTVRLFANKQKARLEKLANSGFNVVSSIDVTHSDSITNTSSRFGGAGLSKMSSLALPDVIKSPSITAGLQCPVTSIALNGGVSSQFTTSNILSRRQLDISPSDLCLVSIHSQLYHILAIWCHITSLANPKVATSSTNPAPLSLGASAPSFILYPDLTTTNNFDTFPDVLRSSCGITPCAFALPFYLCNQPIDVNSDVVDVISLFLIVVSAYFQMDRAIAQLRHSMSGIPTRFGTSQITQQPQFDQVSINKLYPVESGLFSWPRPMQTALSNISTVLTSHFSTTKSSSSQTPPINAQPLGQSSSVNDSSLTMLRRSIGPLWSVCSASFLHKIASPPQNYATSASALGSSSELTKAHENIIFHNKLGQFHLALHLARNNSAKSSNALQNRSFNVAFSTLSSAHISSLVSVINQYIISQFQSHNTKIDLIEHLQIALQVVLKQLLEFATNSLPLRKMRIAAAASTRIFPLSPIIHHDATVSGGICTTSHSFVPHRTPVRLFAAAASHQDSFEQTQLIYLNQSLARLTTQIPGLCVHECQYSHDGDHNGVVHYFGTRGLTQLFNNPSYMRNLLANGRPQDSLLLSLNLPQYNDTAHASFCPSPIHFFFKMLSEQFSLDGLARDWATMNTFDIIPLRFAMHCFSSPATSPQRDAVVTASLPPQNGSSHGNDNQPKVASSDIPRNNMVTHILSSKLEQLSYELAPCANPYVVLDLGPYSRLVPNAFSFRKATTCISAKAVLPQSWQCLGSLDGSHWMLLSDHHFQQDVFSQYPQFQQDWQQKQSSLHRPQRPQHPPHLYETPFSSQTTSEHQSTVSFAIPALPRTSQELLERFAHMLHASYGTEIPDVFAPHVPDHLRRTVFEESPNLHRLRVEHHHTITNQHYHHHDHSTPLREQKHDHIIHDKPPSNERHHHHHQQHQQQQQHHHSLVSSSPQTTPTSTMRYTRSFYRMPRSPHEIHLLSRLFAQYFNTPSGSPILLPGFRFFAFVFRNRPFSDSSGSNNSNVVYQSSRGHESSEKTSDLLKQFTTVQYPPIVLGGIELFGTLISSSTSLSHIPFPIDRAEVVLYPPEHVPPACREMIPISTPTPPTFMIQPNSVKQRLAAAQAAAEAISKQAKAIETAATQADSSAASQSNNHSFEISTDVSPSTASSTASSHHDTDVETRLSSYGSQFPSPSQLTEILHTTTFYDLRQSILSSFSPEKLVKRQHSGEIDQFLQFISRAHHFRPDTFKFPFLSHIVTYIAYLGTKPQQLDADYIDKLIVDRHEQGNLLLTQLSQGNSPMPLLTPQYCEPVHSLWCNVIALNGRSVGPDCPSGLLSAATDHCIVIDAITNAHNDADSSHTLDVGIDGALADGNAACFQRTRAATDTLTSPYNINTDHSMAENTTTSSSRSSQLSHNNNLSDTTALIENLVSQITFPETLAIVFDLGMTVQPVRYSLRSAMPTERQTVDSDTFGTTQDSWSFTISQQHNSLSSPLSQASTTITTPSTTSPRSDIDISSATNVFSSLESPSQSIANQSYTMGHLRSWRLLGWGEQTTIPQWIVLSEHHNDYTMQQPFVTYTWETNDIARTGWFRFFAIELLDVNSAGQLQICLSGFDADGFIHIPSNLRENRHDRR